MTERFVWNDVSVLSISAASVRWTEFWDPVIMRVFLHCSLCYPCNASVLEKSIRLAFKAFPYFCHFHSLSSIRNASICSLFTDKKPLKHDCLSEGLKRLLSAMFHSSLY